MTGDDDNMTILEVEQPRLPAGMSLVYLPWGKVAHLRYGTNWETVCDRGAKDLYADGGLFGTGNQDEWDHARTLPLCKKCFPTGPRTKDETP